MFNVNVLFKTISLLLIISLFLIIFLQHSIFAVIFLIISFLFTFILFFLVDCDFIALIFLFIYIGAISILFLFLIMLLNIKFSNLSKNFIVYFPIGLAFFILLFFILFNFVVFNQLFLKIPSYYLNVFINWYAFFYSLNDSQIYASILYTHFVIHFLLSGFILLIALIGPVYFLKNFKNIKTKNQMTFKQMAISSDFIKKNE